MHYKCLFAPILNEQAGVGVTEGNEEIYRGRVALQIIALHIDAYGHPTPFLAQLTCHH